MTRVTTAVLGALFAVATQGAAQSSDGTTASEVELTVEVNGDWIVGVPPWVAVTLKNNSESSVVLGRARIHPLSRPFSRVEMLRVDAPDKSYSANATASVRISDQVTLTLDSGKSERWVFPLEVGIEPEPGHYELRVSIPISDTFVRVLAGPATAYVTVREATPEESKFLKALAMKTPRQWWFWFGRGRRDELGAMEVPATLRHALGLDLLLRRLLDSGECRRASCSASLSDLSVDEVVLTSGEFFGPELATMKYEILLANQKQAEAQALREEALRRFPEQEWLFNFTRDGSGPRILRTGRLLQRDVAARQ